MLISPEILHKQCQHSAVCRNPQGLSSLIAGVDEAGRGPLAGPLSAAAVVLTPGYSHPEITDSKKLSPAKREELFQVIRREAIGYAVCFYSAAQIDQFNIRQATRLAMAHAAEALVQALKQQGWSGEIHFLVDGNVPMATKLSQETIIKGDLKEQAISAASIVAKVLRDQAMDEAEKLYPGYGFSMHKGYPTAVHKQKIIELGPSPLHRLTFRGVKEFVPAKTTESVAPSIKVASKMDTKKEQIRLPW